MKRNALIAALSALLPGWFGCASYDAKWNAAAAQPTPGSAPADDITGARAGTWTSDADGHTGGLRAIISKKADNQYEAHFHATYKLWFCPCSFQITIPMQVDEDAQGWKHFEGTAALGWPWGEFSHKGSANATRFKSAYQSKQDQGVFEMKRPNEGRGGNGA